MWCCMRVGYAWGMQYAPGGPCRSSARRGTAPGGSRWARWPARACWMWGEWVAVRDLERARAMASESLFRAQLVQTGDPKSLRNFRGKDWGKQNWLFGDLMSQTRYKFLSHFDQCTCAVYAFATCWLIHRFLDKTHLLPSKFLPSWFSLIFLSKYISLYALSSMPRYYLTFKFTFKPLKPENCAF